MSPVDAAAAVPAPPSAALPRPLLGHGGREGVQPRPPAAEPLIRAEALGVTAGGRRILQDVDLAIAPNEIVTVVGPNGAGKTTLIRVLIGAARASRGRVARRAGLVIGYCPQRLAIDRSMPIDAARFLALGQRRGERAAPDAAARALARTGIEHLAGAQVTDLSGGELQRLLLARALMRRPDLLVLDEPTQGLDRPAAAAFYRLIEALKAETGAAVLMVSHDLTVVMAASDRVICLNGHICCQGSPTQVSDSPEYRALFGPAPIGALALYAHAHDHVHDDGHGHDRQRCSHDHGADPTGRGG